MASSRLDASPLPASLHWWMVVIISEGSRTQIYLQTISGPLGVFGSCSLPLLDNALALVSCVSHSFMETIDRLPPPTTFVTDQHVSLYFQHVSGNLQLNLSVSGHPSLSYILLEVHSPFSSRPGCDGHKQFHS